MVLLLITWSKSPIRVACSCRRWHRRRTRKRWNACGKRRSAGKEGVCKSKYGKKCRKRQTKIASVHCTLGGKWTLKFHLLQSVSKWIFMFAKEQQGIFSFTRNDSSNSKYLALAGNWIIRLQKIIPKSTTKSKGINQSSYLFFIFGEMACDYSIISLF